MTTVLPAYSGECGSLVRLVCAEASDQPTPGRKVIKVKPSATPYIVGDTFPVETRSILMDPARYDLKPSDGSWRYYAMGGVVYRVESVSGLVLELIRARRICAKCAFLFRTDAYPAAIFRGTQQVH